MSSLTTRPAMVRTCLSQADTAVTTQTPFKLLKTPGQCASVHGKVDGRCSLAIPLVDGTTPTFPLFFSFFFLGGGGWGGER